MVKEEVVSKPSFQTQKRHYLISKSDRQSILNRQVQLTNVTVQNVNGDRTFWIGQPNGQPVFVVIEPALDAGSAENKIVIKPGQTLNLTGVLRPVPSTQQAQQQWGLSPTEAQALQNQALSIYKPHKCNFSKN